MTTLIETLFDLMRAAKPLTNLHPVGVAESLR
jgi:hypothetical protein